MTGVGRLCLVTLLAAWCGWGQVCRLSVAGLNRNRRVTGPVSAECPGQPLHSAPFGNWGATSNYGPKLNGHQFDGWCHESRVCDNNGSCSTQCRDGWYEWNSCTSHAQFRAPNCTLYNDKDCTEQKTTEGVNVLGTVSVDVQVGCPVDLNNDGTADEGGCTDVGVFRHTANFMSLYELDPFTGDELVQTLYFPGTPVPAGCLALSCPAAGSEWVAPNAYDSPQNEARVYAELATVINSGAFLDSAGVCRGVTRSVQATNAASYAGPRVAAGSLVSLFGRELRTAESDTVTVRIVDAAGTARDAAPLFASAQQVNIATPPLMANGQATVLVLVNGAVRATGVVRVETVAPGVFTMDASGTGAPAALWQRPNQPPQVLQGPIEVSDGNTYLILFATGLRGGATSVTVGGVAAEVLYAGPQVQFAGLDQVNVRLPSSIAGRGLVDVQLTVNGLAANPVAIRVR